MGGSKDTIRDPLGFEAGLGKGGDSGEAGANAANAASMREIAELRRQFDITQGNIEPFLQAGTRALPGQEQASTIGGLDARLGDIFNSDIFGNLVDERTQAVQGQLGAAGLTRSGQALQDISAVPTDIGFQIENLLNNRQTTLAGSGLNAASGLGALGAQNSQAIGGALSQQGQNTASGILADQQANAQASQNLLSTGVAAAAMFFSDPRLKENVEQIAEIADLGVYQWDWIAKTEGTIIADCQTIGFMADEVEEKYPHLVTEFSGYNVIDYPALFDELDAKLERLN
tara:strand:+ start:183 stop:1043 length:861 start_codon:yes stop_codon:yes gene_type:complete